MHPIFLCPSPCKLFLCISLLCWKSNSTFLVNLNFNCTFNPVSSNLLGVLLHQLLSGSSIFKLSIHLHIRRSLILLHLRKKGNRTVLSTQVTFLFVSSPLPNFTKPCIMSMVPHLQITFKPTQSGLCTTTPWTMILGELLVLNPVLSFHSSFYLTSAIFSLVSASFKSLSFLGHCDFLVFLSVFLTIPFLYFVDSS